MYFYDLCCDGRQHWVQQYDSRYLLGIYGFLAQRVETNMVLPHKLHIGENGLFIKKIKNIVSKMNILQHAEQLTVLGSYLQTGESNRTENRHEKPTMKD